MGGVISLRDVGEGSALEVGSKAATLAQMLRAGLPVPEGFVVTARAVERLSGEDAREIEGAVSDLGGGPFAVRSSAIAEDLPDQSYAGQYESVLGVRGAPDVIEAIKRCRASAKSERVAAYQRDRGAGPAGMAVLVQRLVSARAAGVGFTADPVTGDRDVVTVSAVRGLGERLVVGAADADEWSVRGAAPTCLRSVERAIDEREVLAVADLARRVEGIARAPQDIEWAISDDGLHLLQARPITALGDRVEWRAPPGAWARNFRLGEWLGSPVTPLFETWLLERIEAGFYASFQAMFGFPARPPHHAIVNGWYFGSLNFLPSSALAMVGTLARYFLPRFVIRPRWTSVALPPLAGLGVELHVRAWREEILPAYRAAVAGAEARVDSMAPRDLLGLIDELGRAAGGYFASITIVAGYAWKTELPLAAWVRKHGVAESHVPLLMGLGAPATPPHAVSSLDWFHPTLGELGLEAGSPRDLSDFSEERARAEESARAALDDRRRAELEGLLLKAQRFARLREEQIAEFTLPWPVLRRAVQRLAEPLIERGVVAEVADIFFATRAEIEAAIDGAATDLRPAIRERRSRWQKQRSLAPPLVLGETPPMLKMVVDQAASLFSRGADPESIRGLGASPGRATGKVRVIRSSDEWGSLEPGEVLVAPVITPAWTPLFGRASAVVTDTGSILAHASLVAREHGIPAVLGAGDATTRLRDGQLVEVDGGAGTVTIRG
jgi:pyruvate,water dikinase